MVDMNRYRYLLLKFDIKLIKQFILFVTYSIQIYHELHQEVLMATLLSPIYRYFNCRKFLHTMTTGTEQSDESLRWVPGTFFSAIFTCAMAKKRTDRCEEPCIWPLTRLGDINAMRPGGAAVNGGKLIFFFILMMTPLITGF
jgi:hypothetical protein